MFFGKRFSGHHGGHSSGLEILVLSMIKNNDGISGYEIIQKINKKFKNVWKVSTGTIYPLLNRLAKKQFVDIEEKTENNRLKKIYRITKRGIEGLKGVLENNLQPNIDTLGDYIQTVLKAIPSKKHFEQMFCSFPYAFPAFPKYDKKIDESDYTSDNIEQIQSIVQELEEKKEHFTDKINNLDDRLEKYKLILEKLKNEREKHTRVIPIIDDDEDF